MAEEKKTTSALPDVKLKNPITGKKSTATFPKRKQSKGLIPEPDAITPSSEKRAKARRGGKPSEKKVNPSDKPARQSRGKAASGYGAPSAPKPPKMEYRRAARHTVAEPTEVQPERFTPEQQLRIQEATKSGDEAAIRAVMSEAPAVEEDASQEATVAQAVEAGGEPSQEEMDRSGKYVDTKGGRYQIYKKGSQTANAWRDAYAARKAGDKVFEFNGLKYKV